MENENLDNKEVISGDLPAPENDTTQAKPVEATKEDVKVQNADFARLRVEADQLKDTLNAQAKTIAEQEAAFKKQLAEKDNLLQGYIRKENYELGMKNLAEVMGKYKLTEEEVQNLMAPISEETFLANAKDIESFILDIKPQYKTRYENILKEQELQNNAAPQVPTKAVGSTNGSSSALETGKKVAEASRNAKKTILTVKQ